MYILIILPFYTHTHTHTNKFWVKKVTIEAFSAGFCITPTRLISPLYISTYTMNMYVHNTYMYVMPCRNFVRSGSHIYVHMYVYTYVYVHRHCVCVCM